MGNQWRSAFADTFVLHQMPFNFRQHFIDITSQVFRLIDVITCDRSGLARGIGIDGQLDCSQQNLLLDFNRGRLPFQCTIPTKLPEHLLRPGIRLF
ncbi:hypothetical protein D3C86_752100 [compost metagenome]